jgi:hypothetical protein
LWVLVEIYQPLYSDYYLYGFLVLVGGFGGFGHCEEDFVLGVLVLDVFYYFFV